MRRFAAFAALTAPFAAAAVDVEMATQARLLDPTGTPLNGPVTVQVSLYTAATGGTAHWTDTFATTAEDGFVSLVLGSGAPLSDAALQYPAVWVGFSVDGAELARQKLLSVPSAVRSLSTDGLTSGARAAGPIVLGAADATWCDPVLYPDREGALMYDQAIQGLSVCTATGWQRVGVITIMEAGGVRRWADGTAAPSCAAYRNPTDGIHRYEGATGDGLYAVDPGGAGEVVTWCDMTFDGGGWTLVQRTVWTWAGQSADLITNFATWRTADLGSASPGNAFRMRGDAWPFLLSKGDFLLRPEIRTTTGGRCAPLYYKGTGLSLSITGTGATASGYTQPATIFNGTSFSATDVGPSTVCVATNQGAPWWYNSCCSTCPTYGGTYWSDTPHPMLNYVGSVPDFFGNTETQVCGGETPRCQDNGACNYRGIDRLDFYVR